MVCPECTKLLVNNTFSVRRTTQFLLAHFYLFMFGRCRVCHSSFRLSLKTFRKCISDRHSIIHVLIYQHFSNQLDAHFCVLRSFIIIGCTVTICRLSVYAIIPNFIWRLDLNKLHKWVTFSWVWVVDGHSEKRFSITSFWPSSNISHRKLAGSNDWYQYYFSEFGALLGRKPLFDCLLHRALQILKEFSRNQRYWCNFCLEQTDLPRCEAKRLASCITTKSLALLYKHTLYLKHQCISKIYWECPRVWFNILQPIVTRNVLTVTKTITFSWSLLFEYIAYANK